MKISHANIALLVASLIAGTAVAQAADKPSDKAVSAPAKAAESAGNADADLALVQQHCSTCHGIEQVTSHPKTADEWAETMDRMIDHGMQISPEDNKRITDYLATHYGAK